MTIRDVLRRTKRIHFFHGLLLLFAISLGASCSDQQSPGSTQKMNAARESRCEPITLDRIQAVGSRVNDLALGATEEEAQHLIGDPAVRFPMKNKQGTRLDGWMWYYVASCPPANSLPTANFILLIFRYDSGLVAIDQEGFTHVKHRTIFQAQ